jgi:hypothetical protein
MNITGHYRAFHYRNHVGNVEHSEMNFVYFHRLLVMFFTNLVGENLILLWLRIMISHIICYQIGMELQFRKIIMLKCYSVGPILHSLL